ncbi:MAG: hypothetical protein ACLQFI_14005 [Methylocella sp.]
MGAADAATTFKRAFDARFSSGEALAPDAHGSNRRGRARTEPKGLSRSLNYCQKKYLSISNFVMMRNVLPVFVAGLLRIAAPEFPLVPAS